MFEQFDINQLRMACFGGIFLVMALLEAGLPRRQMENGRLKRWPTNWGLILLDSILVRLIFPIGGVGLALLAQENGWGLFGLLGWTGLLAGIVTFLVLDLAVWAQHVASHKVPLFWRIHRVHHADSEVDATTALRFHPIEILLSFVWKGLVIVALGGPVEAVLAFEIVLNASAVFGHANIRIPKGFDWLLRLLIVTPDMHRIHHSVIRRETDSNYGFYLSIWDRLFGTYVEEPEKGHQAMEIGLGPSLTPNAHKLPFSLVIPFLENRRIKEDEGDKAESADKASVKTEGKITQV
ncbi:sterol desaturase family protein [Roseibium album]|uniref:Fatty acid hydroxylase superfamily protein n=1 Tax=Roseibium album TaxID=311410 RepID=A0A0M6ZQG8_9HYPH|nr:sterol desaturase family protein [Roseibium album]CTQ60792.1 Fatty acid hydroxylase superfamily protein [Roseibium album]CTQ65005.1 Fatty acid hydroxylase superfamily protein [Roseibium album]CTQ73126.1 Fatty acid hydroxylase superfamily protein [Roseibium album]